MKRSHFPGSPVSKRPKLNFTSSLVVTNNKPEIEVKQHTNKQIDDIPEWDDDFSGPLFEEACFLADNSQALLENKISPEKVVPHQPITEPKTFDSGAGSSKSSNNIQDDIVKLKLANSQLKEEFKTKEGEVHILRSLLKQAQETKQNSLQQNQKTVEDLKLKYDETLKHTVKELESAMTKLQFKDLELKKITERCKQLESGSNKLKYVEPHALHVNKKHLSQTMPLKTNKLCVDPVDDLFETAPAPKIRLHKRKGSAQLKKIFPDDFFNIVEDSSITRFYPCSDKNFSTTSTHDKYLWAGLPRPTVFIKDIYPSISTLLLTDNYNTKSSEVIVGNVMKHCKEIVRYQFELLSFLKNLQQSRTEFSDPDEKLLNNEEPVFIITFKHLLGSQKYNGEECSSESRRALACILALMYVSPFALDTITHDFLFLEQLKNIVCYIGEIRRPIRYSTLLVGIIHLFRVIIVQKSIPDTIYPLVVGVIKETIYARPKLDVFRELLILLQSLTQHPNVLVSLSNKSDSCPSLHLDSKLRQAMFFNKTTCCLTLLFLQITGLASLKTSFPIRNEITKQTLKLINVLSGHPKCKELNWLPTSRQKERSRFDLTESVVYLLSLTVKDYKNGTYQNITQYKARSLEQLKILGDGAVFLKKVILNDQKVFQNKGFDLFFTLNLCNFRNNINLNRYQKESIEWITELLESSQRSKISELNQKKSTTSALENRILNSLSNEMFVVN